MLHQNRVWHVPDNNLTPHELAKKLTGNAWTLCTGFRCGRVLWLNDSTGPDGAQEYAVVREEDLMQVESITASWCSEDELIHYAHRLGMELDFELTTSSARLRREQIESQHEYCARCR